LKKLALPRKQGYREEVEEVEDRNIRHEFKMSAAHKPDKQIGIVAITSWLIPKVS
jgi:hypothetical protein